MCVSVVAIVPDDQQLLTKPVWVPDSSCKECMVCNLKFTPFIRKHHCRKCGRVICSSCSPYRVALDGSTTVATTDSKKMERICKDCFKDRSTQGIRRASNYNNTNYVYINTTLHLDKVYNYTRKCTALNRRAS